MAASELNALTRARRTDTDRRRQRVQRALNEMKADGSEINVSTAASRAKVHRSFIHRHPDLHAAVLAAAVQALTNPSAASTAISHRSLQAENANLRDHSRRLAHRIKELENRLSTQLGASAYERSGLGAPDELAELRAEYEAQHQNSMDLKRQLEERDEELAAARESIRQLMNELNRGAS